MWLFSTSGFFRIVRDSRDHSLHHIQARTLDDLDDLRALVPELPRPVMSHPGSDYRCRIQCPGDLLPRVMSVLDRQTDEPRAGQSARTPEPQGRLSACHKIWALMSSWGADAAMSRSLPEAVPA